MAFGVAVESPAFFAWCAPAKHRKRLLVAISESMMGKRFWPLPDLNLKLFTLLTTCALPGVLLRALQHLFPKELRCVLILVAREVSRWKFGYSHLPMCAAPNQQRLSQKAGHLYHLLLNLTRRNLQRARGCWVINLGLLSDSGEYFSS